MRKLTYYIASTLDGFIAGPDGQFDFFCFEGDLSAAILAEYPETIPIQARRVPRPDRRREQAVRHGPDGSRHLRTRLGHRVTSPYPHLRQYVFSRTLTGTDPEVEIVSSDPVELVREPETAARMDIWLCGGGKLAAQLLPYIDELIIHRNPIVLGSGIPLFDSPFAPTHFTLTATRPFDTGVVIMTYVKK